jgi:organic radical activating enzyme
LKKIRIAGPTAALAGIPAGLQAQGVWAGRRQLFVRFAGEAETATMYTADALANEIERAMARSKFHSVAIGGRDPLGNAEYLRAALEAKSVPVPVMLDCDGQRPADIGGLEKLLTLIEVTLEGSALTSDGQTSNAIASIKEAARIKTRHSLVLIADERTSDSVVLRVVEQANAASEETTVVIHPATGTPVDRDRRWTMLVERTMALHGDVRLALRLPPPTGMR